jgi:hypothetical protein
MCRLVAFDVGAKSLKWKRSADHLSQEVRRPVDSLRWESVIEITAENTLGVSAKEKAAARFGSLLSELLYRP